MRTGAFVVSLAICCVAQVTVSPPQIGVIRDSAGHIRHVFGTAGAFVLGPPEAAQGPDLRIPGGEAIISGRTIRLEKSSLLIRKPDGMEQRVVLPQEATELNRMSADWLSAPPFAIHVTADGVQVFRLPAAGATR